MHLRLCTLALALTCATAQAVEPTPQELYSQAQAEQPHYLETLKSLVSVDTGTGTEAGLKQVGAELVKRLEALGAKVTTQPATPSVGDNIVGTFKGTGDKDFLLMVHYDTVFGPGTVAKRPFRIEGERAYGPGVADAKGGVAMILHALKLLQDQQYKGYRTLTVLFNPDEEMGSAGSRQLIAELARQHDFVFSYEPPDKDAVTVATNGINRLKLTVNGRASHAGSAPEAGRNALIELAHQLLQLNALGDKDKGTTVNWTLAKAGEKANIIPALASAEADMRYSDLSETERVQEDALRIIKKQLVADTQVELVMEKAVRLWRRTTPPRSLHKLRGSSTARSTGNCSRSPCASAPTPATPTCPTATSPQCWRHWVWSAPACMATTSTWRSPASRPACT